MKSKTRIGSVSERQMEAQRKRILAMTSKTSVGAVGSLPPGSIAHEAATASEKRILEILSSNFWSKKDGRTFEMMGQCIEFAQRLQKSERSLSQEIRYRLRFFTPGTRECSRAVRYSIVMVENVMDHPEYQENGTAWNWLRDEMGNVLLGDDYMKDVGRLEDIIDGLYIAYNSLQSAMQDVNELLPVKNRAPQPDGWEDMVRRVRSRKGFWGSMYPKGYSYYAELARAAAYYLETGDVEYDAADDNDFEAEVSGSHIGAWKISGYDERKKQRLAISKFADILPIKENVKFLVACIREFLPLYEREFTADTPPHGRLRRALDKVDAMLTPSASVSADELNVVSQLAESSKRLVGRLGAIVTPNWPGSYVAEAIIVLCRNLRAVEHQEQYRLRSRQILEQLEFATTSVKRSIEANQKRQWKLLRKYIEKQAGDLLTSGFPSTLPRLEGTYEHRAMAVLIQEATHDFTEWVETGMGNSQLNFDIMSRIRDGFQEITNAEQWIKAFLEQAGELSDQNVWRIVVFSCSAASLETWRLETVWENLNKVPRDEIGREKTKVKKSVAGSRKARLSSRTTKSTVGALPFLTPDQVIVLGPQNSALTYMVQETLDQMSTAFRLRYFSSVFKALYPLVNECIQVLGMKDMEYIPSLLKAMKTGDDLQSLQRNNEFILTRMDSQAWNLNSVNGARWYIVYEYIFSLHSVIEASKTENSTSALIDQLTFRIAEYKTFKKWNSSQQKRTSSYLEQAVRDSGINLLQDVTWEDWKPFLLLLKEQILLTANDDDSMFRDDLADFHAKNDGIIPVATIIRADAYRQFMRLKEHLSVVKNSPKMMRIIGMLESSFREMNNVKYFISHFKNSDKKMHRLRWSAMAYLIRHRFDKKIEPLWMNLRSSTYVTGESILSGDEKRIEREFDEI